MFAELIRKNRSYRKFDQSVEVTRSQLETLVGYARLSATSGNLQPLKFALCNEPAKTDAICESLIWAYFLKDWKGPKPGERPGGFIVILGDRNIRKDFGVDAGIAAQSILLGAVEMGLGGCMFASSDEKKFREILTLPENCEILLTVAIGKPAEQIILEDIKDGDYKYWRDETQTHHVPKRTMGELIVNSGDD